jgi:hypothetical protein
LQQERVNKLVHFLVEKLDFYADRIEEKEKNKAKTKAKEKDKDNFAEFKEWAKSEAERLSHAGMLQ